MTIPTQHVTVCICTYRRANLLKGLLHDLRNQQTGGLFTYSIIVVDNDAQKSAESVVAWFRDRKSIPLEYYVVPKQSIALARNMAVEHAQGEFLVFIDDDESPSESWLLTLVEACIKYKAHGVLGPVHPRYEVPPPKWVVNGRFYDRPSYPTGTIINWQKGRTGNTLLRREVFKGMDTPFRPEFRTGEDMDFFRRAIEKGYSFVWCHEAPAYEVVPPVRWSRSFLLKRALLRGYTSRVHPTFGAREIVTSLVAAPVYSIALPVALLLGQSIFMSILVRLCDHVGRLLGLVGINPVDQAYVTTK